MIDIDNDVPLPSDGWTSAVNSPSLMNQQMGRVKRQAKPDCGEAGHSEDRCGNAQCLPSFNPPQPGPNDCTFIGGPLNGKFGPIEGNAKVVEIEIYNANGSVASVELYALGDAHPTPSFRVHVGTKQ